MIQGIEGTVLITGGSGFLGRGIMRQAQRENWPARFIVYSRSEYRQESCRHQFPEATYILGDIRDTEKLTIAMNGVDTVIHAGALKYVPEAENNVEECFSINVEGTRSVLKAATRSQRVSHIIGISTDKAADPINTYGLSKAMMERLFREYARLYPYLHFAMTRYGNVIASTGSVIPKFLGQLGRQEAITITDSTMTRFWISIEDAVNLIKFAYTSPRKDRDLTRLCIVIPQATSLPLGNLVLLLKQYMNLSGEAVIHTTGMRPGEKKHEVLLAEHELPFTYFLSHSHTYEFWPGIEAGINRLVNPITSNTSPSIDSKVLFAAIKSAMELN